MRPHCHKGAVPAARRAVAAADRHDHHVAPVKEPLGRFGVARIRLQDHTRQAGSMIDHGDTGRAVALRTADSGIEQARGAILVLHGNPVRLLAPAALCLPDRAGAGGTGNRGGTGGKQEDACGEQRPCRVSIPSLALTGLMHVWLAPALFLQLSPPFQV